MSKNFVAIITLALVCLWQVSHAQFEAGTKFDCFEREPLSIKYEFNDKACYDYKITYKGFYRGDHVTGCMLINSEMGLCLSFGFDNIYQARCNYNFNTTEFHAYMYTLGGYNYTYYNLKRPSGNSYVLKHFARVGKANSTSVERMMLDKVYLVTENIEFFGTGHDYKGIEFKEENGTTRIWVQIDGPVPPFLKIHQFLGGYGVGFANTNVGNLLILKFQDDKHYTVVEEVKYLMDRECFHPHMFMLENTTVNRENIQEVSKLEMDAYEQKMKITRTTTCAELKERYLAYREQSMGDIKRKLEETNSRRVDYKSKSDMEVAYDYDRLYVYRQMAMEDAYKRCVIETDLEHGRYSPEEKPRAIERSACLKYKIDKINTICDEIEAVEKSDTKNKKDKLQRLYAQFPLVIKEHRC